MGPFVGEEEGTGIASDVVKLEGEDLATPGCLRDDRVSRYASDSESWWHAPLACVRKFRDRNNCPISGHQTK